MPVAYPGRRTGNDGARPRARAPRLVNIDAGTRTQVRLRRSNLSKPGYGRRRSGRGFSYLGTDGRPLEDARERQRIKDLVIPPAWRDVWISPDERGHIQATGFDTAGRKQYIYHPLWRERQDRAKFDHALEVAERLPGMRDRLCHDLTHGRGLTRDRVLAAIVRLLDLGMFRIGGALRRPRGGPVLRAVHAAPRPRAQQRRLHAAGVRGQVRRRAHRQRR